MKIFSVQIISKHKTNRWWVKKKVCTPPAENLKFNCCHGWWKFIENCKDWTWIEPIGSTSEDGQSGLAGKSCLVTPSPDPTAVERLLAGWDLRLWRRPNEMEWNRTNVIESLHDTVFVLNVKNHALCGPAKEKQYYSLFHCGSSFGRNGWFLYALHPHGWRLHA